MPASVVHTITGLNGAEVILARFNGGIDRSSFFGTMLSLLTPGPLRARIERSAVISSGIASRLEPLDLMRRHFDLYERALDRRVAQAV